MDGKCVAPSSKSVEGITELSAAPWDDRIIQQGSKHKDRVFLQKKSDRTEALHLANNQISCQEFLDFESASLNMFLIKNLIEFVMRNHGNETPGTRMVHSATTPGLLCHKEPA